MREPLREPEQYWRLPSSPILGGWAAGRLGGWAAGRLGGWAAEQKGKNPDVVMHARISDVVMHARTLGWLRDAAVVWGIPWSPIVREAEVV